MKIITTRYKELLSENKELRRKMHRAPINGKEYTKINKVFQKNTEELKELDKVFQRTTGGGSNYSVGDYN